MKNVIVKQIKVVINITIQNPFPAFAKGIPSTFIPKNPDTIVGIENIKVTEVKNCITLF
jgi:hypothetical protein